MTIGFAAERRFCTFAPQNIYIGKDNFSTLLRKANPLGKTLFSIMVPQHQQICNWLKSLPNAVWDPLMDSGAAGTAAVLTTRNSLLNWNIGKWFNAATVGGSSMESKVFDRLADNFNPYEPTYRAMLRSGLVGVNLVTAGYGQSALVRLTLDQPDSMMLQPDGVLFTAVTNDPASLDIVRTALEMESLVLRLSRNVQPAFTREKFFDGQILFGEHISSPIAGTNGPSEKIRSAAGQTCCHPKITTTAARLRYGP